MIGWNFLRNRRFSGHFDRSRSLQVAKLGPYPASATKQPKRTPAAITRSISASAIAGLVRAARYPTDASAPQPRRRSGVISPSSTESLRTADTADKLLETVTEAAFGQRRKMLRQSLRSLGADVTALISAADVSPMARAEDIPIDGFVSLARALAVQHGLRHDAGA